MWLQGSDSKHTISELECAFFPRRDFQMCAFCTGEKGMMQTRHKWLLSAVLPIRDARESCFFKAFPQTFLSLVNRGS